ncbi:MAG: hypothetical protein Q8K24_05960 [Hydrogenophaga sp.]|nr:hypothetical protein [Hydrogenophaga sp.]
MPIQSDDVKLLRSAVMADVPEGGGAATGIEIVDGQSNNIFPDTSTDDRAAGRVNFRKVFGAAHTDDTDTLLGASFAVLKPPEDPLVHVTMFSTPGWADTRATAKELVERLLVKGPRLPCRLMDTHYAGAMLLQMYQVGGTNFPVSGDAIAVRNPDGREQYVRVTKVTLGVGTFNASEGGSVMTFTANTALCEIGQALQFDVLGPPVARVINDANFAQIFTTTASSGIAFHGVKPLAAPAVVGARSVMAAGGIYTPLVPAATVEEPLIDIAPLTNRVSLSRTALAPVSLPAMSLSLGAGTVLRLPTRIEPGTLTMTHVNVSFTADVDGTLRQGSAAVGVVDHRERTITMLAGSPNYGAGMNAITYRPATAAGATTHSDLREITTANQGLGWVYAFEPPPAPGTFTLSYMAQGRWYELIDNGTGKVSGADNSYGAGTLNYGTGSVAVTLGALPDVGSALIFTWGTADAARAPLSADLSDRAYTEIALDHLPEPGSLVLTWSRAGTNYTASVSSVGTVTGPARVTIPVRTPDGKFTFRFSPEVLPDGGVSVSYKRSTANGSGPFVNNTLGAYTLGSGGVVPGSVRFTVLTAPPPGQSSAGSIYVWDNLQGLLVFRNSNGAVSTVGAINYETGQLTVNNSADGMTYRSTTQVSSSSGGTSGTAAYYSFANAFFYNQSVPLQNTNILSFTYTSSATPVWDPTTPVQHLPAWRAEVRTIPGMLLRTADTVLTWGGTIYASRDGVLQTSWSPATGAGTPSGNVSSDGFVSFTALPPSGTNALTWQNAAHNRAADLEILMGVFRVLQAPIKTGGFQIQSGTRIGIAADTGAITGGNFGGQVDFQRGIVRWTGNPVPADTITYNAVFLQYLPLDGALLGLETARLPLDGKVPIYRPGGQVIVHNTLTTALPNPLTKGTTYNLGRQRVAAVVVRTAAGVKVPGNRYAVDFNAGTIVFPLASDLTGFDQPFTVHHRIEDELMLLRADISGKLDLVAGLTHNYPAGSSYISSKLRNGDLFARAFGYIEQSSWTGAWSDTRIGDAPTANYNEIDFPIVTTNRGAITERWAVIFTGATQVRVVGADVGQVLTNVSTTGAIEPLNPQTGAPYFRIPSLGWGGGWAVGNVLRFNTAAAGAPAWVVRTTLQGPATVASDAATIAFRSDVDA